MNTFLISAADILSQPWGMAIFLLIDAAILLLIVALNYRWLFKRTLDLVFSAIFLLLFFPFFLLALLVQLLYNRSQNAYKTLFTREYYVGKREKIICIRTFSTERIEHDAAGNLLPEQVRLTKYGKVLRVTKMKYYPCLASVFLGKMSFVGPRLISLSDASALNDLQAERFRVRPGLVSSLEKYGGESLTYPDLFEEDAEYVRRVNLFRDIGFFCARLIRGLRGEAARPYGECTDVTYVEWLLQKGELDAAEANAFVEAGSVRLKSYLQKRNAANGTVNRTLMR